VSFQRILMFLFCVLNKDQSINQYFLPLKSTRKTLEVLITLRFPKIERRYEAEMGLYVHGRDRQGGDTIVCRISKIPEVVIIT